MFDLFKSDLQNAAVILIAAIAFWNLLELNREFGYNSHRYNWRVLLEEFGQSKLRACLRYLFFPVALLIATIVMDTQVSNWQLVANLLCLLWVVCRAVLCLWASFSWREVKV